MSNINININFESFSRLWSSIVARFSHLTGTDALFILIAILMPPLAVFLKVGISTQFWINIVLTILGVVPGQVHALWVVLF